MQLDDSVSVAVDFGCGCATFSIPAAGIVRKKVVGLDIEPEMPKYTGDTARNVGVEICDFIAQGTGFPDDSVDYEMLFNILHAENPDILLQEAYRILKKKGRLVSYTGIMTRVLRAGQRWKSAPGRNSVDNGQSLPDFVLLTRTLTFPPITTASLGKNRNREGAN